MTRNQIKSNWEKPFFFLIILAMLAVSFLCTFLFSEHEKPIVKDTELPELPSFLAWNQMSFTYPETETEANPFVVTFHYDPPPPPPPPKVEEVKEPEPPPPPPPTKTVHIEYQGLYTSTSLQNFAMLNVLDDSTGETLQYTLSPNQTFSDGFILKEADIDKITVLAPDGALHSIPWSHKEDFTFVIKEK